MWCLAGRFVAAATQPTRLKTIMTTLRLYYTDSYLTQFQAEVVELTSVGDAPAVVLDRSCFYPTSGGQPHDTGRLNGIPVIDVLVREQDGAVLHVLEGDAPESGSVSGEIDWARRFDHMQHHTGQHILSQAFVRLAGAETVGFHISPDSITIDLDRPHLDPALVDAVEDLANQIVTENRPVRAWYPSAEELPALRLRKVPEVAGKMRVVTIEDFDETACGGTHVARTGEIGLIKVLRVDRRGEIARVEFRCGGRALRDYRAKNAMLRRVSAALTTGIPDIPAVLDKMREENKALRRTVKTWRARALAQEAEELWRAAEQVDGVALVVRAFEERDAGELRQLVQRLIAHPSTVALCASAGDRAHLIAARSDDLDLDMVAALKRGLAVWEIERGGGRPSFAQGGGVPATFAAAQAALLAAAEWVRTANDRG